jgi:hypothetical protein
MESFSQVKYPGVVVLGGIKYSHDELTVGIGLLCKSRVPDLELLKKDVEETEWPGSIEGFVTKIAEYLDAGGHYKGVLVTARSGLFNSAHTVVTGEVLQDFDVKQEMYHLLKVLESNDFLKEPDPLVLNIPEDFTPIPTFGLRRCTFQIEEKIAKEGGGYDRELKTYNGFFHRWFDEGAYERYGDGSMEGETNVGALCEDEDGQMHKCWHVGSIKFLDAEVNKPCQF